MSALGKACSNPDGGKEPLMYIPEASLAVIRILNSGMSARPMSELHISAFIFMLLSSSAFAKLLRLNALSCGFGDPTMAK